MLSLSKQLDHLLLDIVWSLWTELGVAGVKSNHRNVLITLEELILFTAVLSEEDPRLRDESLDWCAQYHHFVSISRLKTILKDFDHALDAPFAQYSATLHMLARTAWPLYLEAKPLRVTLSRKSSLRPLESPALLNIRARSIFGTGARADLVTFFVLHPKMDFAVSELTEIGYSKRNLAEILEEFSSSGLFSKFLHRNQLRYSLSKNEPLVAMLSPIPEFSPSWRLILKLLLSLRICIKRTESRSESSKLVEIRNMLLSLQNHLTRLNLTPPSLQGNYLGAFQEWLLTWVGRMAQGIFTDGH